MTLSSETLKRLQAAQQKEANYHPNTAIQRELQSRSLVMVVAPTATGKTYIMKRVRTLDSRFGLSSVLSTRDPRPDDEPAMFRLFKNNDQDVNHILDLIEQGDLVQYAIHPSEHTIYGTELLDHPHEYNLLAALSGSINQLQSVGFGRTIVIGLVAPPKPWLTWFNQRYPTPTPKRLARLLEAKQSYSDLLKRTDVHWTINTPDDADETAQAIIDIVDETDKNNADAISLVHQMMELIEVMLIKAKGNDTL